MPSSSEEGKKCHPCVRNTLLPISQEGHSRLSTQIAFRSGTFEFRAVSLLVPAEPHLALTILQRTSALRQQLYDTSQEVPEYDSARIYRSSCGGREWPLRTLRVPSRYSNDWHGRDLVGRSGEGRCDDSGAAAVREGFSVSQRGYKFRGMLATSKLISGAASNTPDCSGPNGKRPWG